MIIQCVAIAGVTVLELMALHKDINGRYLALAMAVIGGIAGYTLEFSLPG